MVLAAAAPESSFGIPFPRGFEDFRDVEMWPLIQAFALESDHQESVCEGRKFFTMQYKVQGMYTMNGTRSSFSTLSSPLSHY